MMMIRMMMVTLFPFVVLCVVVTLIQLLLPSMTEGFSTKNRVHPAAPVCSTMFKSDGVLPSSSSSTTSTCLFSSSPSTADTTTTTSTSTTTTTTSKGLLKRDRYVATNRFAVRPGREGKFEQRWATRKSRLATLDGFRYFHLMRRVTLSSSDGDDEDDDNNNSNSVVSYDGGIDKESRQGNYVSFTIWEKKSDFSAWRNGEAFKEAHGGTSIGAFLSTMVNSALVLEGPPRPAFYDGLLVQSTIPTTIPVTVDGWRDVVVDKDNPTILPTECFIACNQFYVPVENGAAFEARWADRVSTLKDCDGFVAFTMLRRDGQQKGHGTVPMTESEPSYMSTTIWRDRASFDTWKKGPSFQQAHGQQQQQQQKQQPAGTGGETTATTTATPPPSPPKPLWSRPPQPIFYEGTLVITSDQGA